MATAIEQETNALTAHFAPLKVRSHAPARPHLPVAANANHINDNQTPGLDPLDFVRANRIHVKDGSLFVGPYLVLHPRELDPANEETLRKKLQLTFSINNPTFYEAPERASIALNLGQLIPGSLGAEGSQLMEAIKEHNKRVDTGVDARLQQELNDKRRPFTAIIRDVVESPKNNPVEMELLKNGLSIYLLLREKLTQQGYLGKLSDYVQRNNTPDQILSDLSDKLGITPLQVREAALKGGVDGIGALLGLEPRYVADVKALTDYASTQDFGYNLIEHWHLGRQLLGINAPIAQKIVTGLDARITAKMEEYRAQVHHQYDVPAPVKKEETRIAQALSLVEPIQRALMYKLGYEICYSPEVTADDIAFHKGIYGLHRKAANDLSDIRGTYRIYFSGKGDLKGSMRTLTHEIAHNMWPREFTAQEVTRIDELAGSDQQRFAHLKRVMDEKFPEFERFLKAFQAGTEQEKAAVIASAKDYFAPYGVSIDEGLLPYLRDANDFRFMVQHAYDTLSVEGTRYNRSGYDSTPERFREVISRFAELKQVEYRSQPQLLHYLAPGLDQIFEAHYLPHLNRVYQSILATENPDYAAQHALQKTHHKNTSFVGDAVAANNPGTATLPAPVAELPGTPVNPRVQEQPKVREHVTMPPAPIAACMADDLPQENMPLNMVNAQSILNHGYLARQAANGILTDKLGA